MGTSGQRSRPAHLDALDPELLATLVQASVALISSADLKAALDHVLDLAVALLPADAYGVWRYFAVPEAWKLAAARNLSAEYMAQAFIFSPASDMPSAPVAIPDISISEECKPRLEIYRKEGIAAMLRIPMMLYGEDVGLMVFYYRRPHQFSEWEIGTAEHVTRMAAAALQVAERNLEQQRLRAEAELALSAANAWSWEIDPQTGAMQRSQDVAWAYGVSSRSIGTVPGALQNIHPDDRERVLEALAHLQPHLDNHMEYRVCLPDGSQRWLWSRGRVMPQTDGSLRIVGVSMDITERKRAEEAMRTAEQLAMLGRMAATVAHEINNPLEAVTNLIYLATDDTALSPQTRELLSHAEGELNRVGQIARQTLGFYRESTAPAPLRLAEVLEELLRTFEKKIASKNLSLERRYRVPGLMEGRRGEIRQVLGNLLANAIDASPQDATITLALHAVRHPKTQVPGLRILIADQGAGVPAQHRRRIFEPFFTTKQHVGTGLGLWVSRQIAAGHGGGISFRNLPGKGRGAVFSLFLPDRFVGPLRSTTGDRQVAAS